MISKIAGIATRDVDGVHAVGGGTARAVGALRERIPGARTNHAHLAKQFMLLIDGATVTALHERGPGPAWQAKAIATALITEAPRHRGTEAPRHRGTGAPASVP